jgi:hypothetical protein
VTGPSLPILRSFSEPEARDLRFSVGVEHRFAEGMPLYTEVRRGGCVLHVSEHPGDAVPGTAVRMQVPDAEPSSPGSANAALRD